MARGGFRPGAGRPKGAKKQDKTSKAAQAEKALEAHQDTKKFKTALDYAMDVINDPNADKEQKTRLAIALLPFQHPKLADKPATIREDRAKNAMAAASGKYAPPPPPGTRPKVVVDNG